MFPPKGLWRGMAANEAERVGYATVNKHRGRSAPTLYGKEHRKVDHINASEEARGVDADEAKNIAYATVNKQAQR